MEFARARKVSPAGRVGLHSRKEADCRAVHPRTSGNVCIGHVEKDRLLLVGFARRTARAPHMSVFEDRIAIYNCLLLILGSSAHDHAAPAGSISISFRALAVPAGLLHHTHQSSLPSSD